MTAAAVIAIELTPAQIRRVCALGPSERGEADNQVDHLTADAEHLLALLARADSGEQRGLSASLLFGLYVLASLPGDGSSIAISKLVKDLGEPAATLHRYLQTLVVARLAQQNKRSREYSLASGLSSASADGE